MQTMDTSGSFSLMILGITLLFVLRVAYRDPPPAADLLRYFLTLVGAVLFWVGLLGFLLILAFKAGYLLWLWALVLWVLADGRSRKSRQRALLNLVRLTIDKGMPLAPMALAFAREQRGRYRQKVERWAGRMDAGMPIEVALQRSRGVLPREARLAVSIGQHVGDIPGALRDLATSQLFREQPWRRQLGRFVYLGWFALVVFPAIVLFLEFKIAPSLQKILQDFGTPPPGFTQALSAFRTPWTLVGLEVLAVAGFVFMLCVTLQYLGWMPRGLPLVSRLLRKLDSAVVMRALALGIQQRRSMPQMLDLLGQHYFGRAVRRKLRRAGAAVGQGAEWTAALARERLIGRPDAAVLEAAQRVGNLPWALRELAESNERRLMYRLAAWQEILYPIGMFVLGSLTLLVMLTYFMPLVEIITRLAQ